MKKQNLLLCSLLAASLMLFSGFTPSDSGRKLKPVEEKQVERYTIRDINIMRFSLGTRSKLWEDIESEKLPIFNARLDAPWSPPVTLEHMEAESSYIVIGSFAEEMTTSVDSHALERVTSGVTVSSFHVKQVLKGSLKAGDVIPIEEIVFIRVIEGPEMLSIISSYLPSKSGEDYLFFLNQLSENDLYTPNGYSITYYDADRRYGRYPILTPEQKARGIENLTPHELSVESFSPDYICLYNEVAEKYGI